MDILVVTGSFIMKTQRNLSFVDTLMIAIEESDLNSQTKEILVDIINEKIEAMGNKFDPTALTEALSNYVDVKKLLAQAKGPKKRLKIEDVESTPAKRKGKNTLLNQEAVTLLLNSVMSCRGLTAAPDFTEFMHRLMTEIYTKMINRANFYVNTRTQQVPNTLPMDVSSNPRKVLKSLKQQELFLRDQIAIEELKDSRLTRRRRNKDEDPQLDELEGIQEAVQSLDWRTSKTAQFDTLEITTDTRRRITLRDVSTMLTTDMQGLACFFKPKLAELL